MILLSDANVLIDLGHVQGLDILCQLETVEVLDVVLEECDHPSQPDLVTKILDAGVQLIETKVEWLQGAQVYRQGNLSNPDLLNFYYARAHSRLLLTNEKPLRTLCQQQNVTVYGTLWVIQEAYQRKLSTPATLCQWLETLSNLDRRLPKQVIKQLKTTLGCG
ncbi:MAG: hypothetical protein AAF243_14565 [Cyanobacteria bacterium P01_A01_bin.137]